MHEISECLCGLGSYIVRHIFSVSDVVILWYNVSTGTQRASTANAVTLKSRQTEEHNGFFDFKSPPHLTFTVMNHAKEMLSVQNNN